MSAMAPAPQSSSTLSTWGPLVERVRTGDPNGLGDLYALLERGVRLMLARQMGRSDVDDKVHDTFLILVQAIRRGELREPERLLGFIRTIVRRQVAGFIDQSMRSRRGESGPEIAEAIITDALGPEDAAIGRQTSKIIEGVLRSISGRDREILTRFYLLEQSQDEICREMDLSDTQFRLLKSRAKARFGELGRRRLKGRTFFMRGIPSSIH